MPKDAQSYISWPDTERLGFKVARVNAYPVSPQELLPRLREIGVQLVISRVPTAEIQLINQLEDLGFRLKDVQATYSIDLQQLPELEQEQDLLLRDYVPSDKQALIELTRSSLQNFGHYANNQALGAVNTGDIYADWVKRACEDPDTAQYIAVAEISGQIAGCAIYRIEEPGPGGYATSIMGVVDPKQRSRGLIRKIISLGAYWAARQGLARLEYNVQITNIPVNKALAAHGCRIVRSESTLHCWI